MSTHSNRRFLLIILGAVAAFFGALLIVAMSSSSTPSKPSVDRSQRTAVVVDEAPPSSALAAIDTGPDAMIGSPPTPIVSSAPPEVVLTNVIDEPWEAAPASATKVDENIEIVPEPEEVVSEPSLPAPVELPVIRPEPEEVVAPSLPQAEPLVEVVDSAIALFVEDRMPLEVSDVFETDAGKLTAWIQVKNTGAPTHVTMVWRKGDEVAFDYQLKIGKSSGWRTWTTKTVRDWDVGSWAVDVLDANGTVVDTIEFEIDAVAELDAI